MEEQLKQMSMVVEKVVTVVLELLMLVLMLREMLM